MIQTSSRAVDNMTRKKQSSGHDGKTRSSKLPTSRANGIYVFVPRYNKDDVNRFFPFISFKFPSPLLEQPSGWIS